MAVVLQAPAAFELKSAALTLVAVMLKTTDLARLSQALDERFADAPGLFDNDPVAIDLSHVRDADEPIDFVVLMHLLRGHKMLPVAVKSGNAQQMEDALAAGLSEAHGSGPGALPVRQHAPIDAGAEPPAKAVAAAAPATEPEPEPMPEPPRTALVIDKPLRSGQRVYAKGADLIVLAVVSFGAEVIADGNIHVYAPLRGRALAGALGDTRARIFTTCMEPQLLSIAGIYRTTEHELPAAVLGKPAQVRLAGEKLVVEPLQSD
ncbi:septum site-determining protein MinC [Rhizobacter sp. Root404]|uniref:septum site-determining protein MinC n=1 Tax=Rhizobacter sp. Root404 TaxID=1736528 RepID=UPI0006FFADDC|nr:septum site-determining protein MinC [Rhizobacter sp. Root404]KQW35438.1 septum site-determining protein MinC [Rhizobacter sp. Root404]